MKIAIPVVDLEENKNLISKGLTATGQICIHDNSTMESVWMKTAELAENMGELLPALEKRQVSVIITSKVQPMALKVLVNKGFYVYKSKGDRLEENILSFNRNELSIFNMDSAMVDAIFCGGSCDICNTDCQESTDN